MRYANRRAPHSVARFKLKPITAALMLALGANGAYALPQGGVIAAGNASITSTGPAMTIQQSSNSATYNWQSFNIGQAESVRFNQPSATSVALNYVLGNTNSQIDGTLSSNGQLFLSNPNGIVFGATAQVNAAGLTLEAGAGHLAIAGHINIGSGSLIANAGLINNTGLIEATSATAIGGRIVLSATSAISNTGSIDASGTSGGSILLNAGSSVLQQGRVLANGSTGNGGSIALSAGYRILQNSTAITRANGSNGGSISYRADTVNAEAGLMLSGTIETNGSNGSNGNGGSIVLTGTNVELLAIRIAASGSGAGGNISIGGGFQGRDAAIANAQNVSINTATRIDASGAQGNGGNVVVWSDQQTMYSGDIKATGGMTATRGGQVEVSGKNLGFNGMVDASTANGLSGSLLLDPANIVIQAGTGNNTVPVLFNLGQKGELTQLSNGNLIVADQFDSTIAANSGAVWMFNGTNGSLISTLTGASANDNVGAGYFPSTNAVWLMPNGNFLVSSPGWHNGDVTAGALTWGSATTGVSGAVSAANSIVGQARGEVQGLDASNLIELPNGNFVWRNPNWSDMSNSAIMAGAATFIRGNAPTVGTFKTNSLVGSNSYDKIGSLGIWVLPNGNYLVSSPTWAGVPTLPYGKGAVTWGSGTTGVTGVVSAANSLVGSTVGDGVGSITILSNGNYVISSPGWSNGAATNAGAVTWGSGVTGVTGVISSANSLVGSKTNDMVGGGWNGAWGGVVTLANGNYLVHSPTWDNGAIIDAGALTWGSGATGVTDVVSAANSVVGQASGDIPSRDIAYPSGDIFSTNNVAKLITLPSGGVLIVNPFWDNGTVQNVGAVTFIRGDAPTTGTLLANSLVGGAANDHIGSSNNFSKVTVLPNGNYVVISSLWDNGLTADAGAVTWGSGTTGVTGTISAANSLVGNGNYDYLGSGGITPLSNGNYLINSPRWGAGSPISPQAKGAVTWSSGTSGVQGTLSAANSLVGSLLGDNVGAITLLPNGNYLVNSFDWGAGKGAVTWGSGTTGVSGVISSANSLVGNISGTYDPAVQHFLGGDGIGIGGITLLPSGNYLVQSPVWSNGAATASGAVTWGNGTTGVKGLVSAANSLVGTSRADAVGIYPATVLPNGDYLVVSPLWNNGTALMAGAVTQGSGTTGISGAISAANSLVGTATGDGVGVGGITLLSGGNYLISSPMWNNGALTEVGAVTWKSGTASLTGTISATNSLIGGRAGDRVSFGTNGADGITVLSNGNYLVNSPNWSNGAVAGTGALTWGSGTTGVTGVVNASNSIVGEAMGEVISTPNSMLYALPSGNLLRWDFAWDNGAAIDAGAVTFINGNSPTTGTFRSNSLMGSTANDQIGSTINGTFDLTVLDNGNYLVGSSMWSNGALNYAGALTWGSGTAGVQGYVSAANSIVGDANGKWRSGGSLISLSSGNYLMVDSSWGATPAGGQGAVTFINGNGPTTGTLLTNSLVGSNTFDSLGSGGIRALPNGNYLVVSPHWVNGTAYNAGAVTWGNGTTGIVGSVSASNSLVGTSTGDYVGESVTILPSGNYLVSSQWWGAGRGALTWGSGNTGVTGAISATNSLVGTNSDTVSTPGDRLGGFTILSNGNYVSWAPLWNNKRGAVTWGSGTTGVKGQVSAANSLVGSTGSSTLFTTSGAQGDQVGNGCSEFSICSGISVLPNGDYIVRSPFWSNGTVNSAGAVTWVDGNTGVTGAVSSSNSFIGRTAGDRLGLRFQVLANSNVTFSGTNTPWTVYNATRIDLTASLGYTTSLGYAAGRNMNMIFDPSVITNITNTGTAVTLQASNDIRVNSAIITTPDLGVPKGGNLTLQAGRSILINADIDTAGGDLTLIANDLPANGVVLTDRLTGIATIRQTSGATINTGTGMLSMEMRNGTTNVRAQRRARWGMFSREMHNGPTSGAVTLGNITAGSLNVLSSGAINQSAGSSLAVAGASTINARNNSITLANATNDFVGTVTATGSSVWLNDANALNTALTVATWAATSAGGNLNVSGSVGRNLATTTTGTGNTTFAGATTVGGNLNVSSIGAVQRATATTPLSVTGTTTVNGVNCSSAVCIP